MGPGSHLARMLKRRGFSVQKGCLCLERAEHMDRQGADWCEGNQDTIVEWLRLEAKERRLPFLKAYARHLVRRAIRLARHDEAALGK